MSSRPAWSTRASSRTGSKATEKPCLEKQNKKTKKKQKTNKQTKMIPRSQRRKKTHKLTSPTMKTKLAGDSNHWSLISLNVNGLNSPIKRHRLTDWIRKQNPSFFGIQETHLNLKDRHGLRVKGWGKK